MTPEEAGLQTVMERLAKVERQNRRVKAVGTAALTLLAGALLMGVAAPTGESVEARAFVLRDDAGQVRAQLAMKEAGPELTFFDARERAQVRLLATDDSRGLYLSDRDDRTRLSLVVSDGGPRLSLSNAEGRPQAELGVKEQGPSLVLYDTHRVGRVWLHANDSAGGLGLYDHRAMRAALTVTEFGPVLLFSDLNRKPLAMFSATRKSGSAPTEPSLILYDESGNSRAVLGSALGSIAPGVDGSSSPASLVLYHEEGGTLWSAP